MAGLHRQGSRCSGIGLSAALSTLAFAAPVADARWREALPLTEPDRGSSAHTVAVTGADEAVAIWGEHDPGYSFAMRVNSRVFRVGGEPQPVQRLAEEMSSGTLAAGADTSGGALAVWTLPSGEIQASLRPGGGVFGSPEGGGGSFSWGSSWADIRFGHDGESSAVWHDWRSQRFYGSFRSAAGQWERNVPVTPPTGDPGTGPRVGIIRPTGEALVVWRENSRGRILAGGRSATGELLPVEALSSGERWADHPQLGVDVSGNAVVLWQEADQRGYSDTLMVASKPSGESFEAAQVVWGAARHAEPGRLVMDRDGRVTVAFKKDELIVLSGEFGEPLAPVGRFWSTRGGPPVLAASPNGHTIVGWENDLDQWVTSTRAPGGEFGAVEDLRPGCELVDSVRLAISDSGLAAATMNRQRHALMTLSSPTEQPAKQHCTNPTPIPQPPPSPSPAWVETPVPPSLVQRPPGEAGAGAARLRLGGLRATSRSGRVTAQARIACGVSCTATATAVLRSRGGRPLARGTLRATRVRRPRTVTLRLKRGGHLPTGSPTRSTQARLSLRVTARFPGGIRRTKRSTTLVELAGVPARP